MPLYRPSELSAFLGSLGHRSKRTLSQNFLIDGNIVAKIVGEVELHSDMLVVEIGPGPGVLTEAFLASGARVVAIEKDEVLARALRRLEPDGSRLFILASDVLDCSFDDIVAAHPTVRVVLVSNLPYHLTTPILQKVLASISLFSRVVLMMQEEAARRLTGGRAGIVGMTAELVADVRYAFRVPKGCFWPRPNVDSAVLSLDVRPPLLIGEEPQLFSELLRIAFAHRRKTIFHSLLQRYSSGQLTSAFDQAKIVREARPDDVPMAGWVELTKALKTKV